jgi:hypothetical protein
MNMEGYDFAIKIYYSLLPISFLIIVFAWIFKAKDHTNGDMIDKFKQMVGVFTVILCIFCYPKFTISSSKVMYALNKSIGAKVDKAIDNWKNTKIDGEDETFNFSAKIAKFFYKTGWVLAYLLRKMLIYIQAIMMYVMIAVSPIVLSFLLIQSTQRSAVQFILTTFGIILWPIGFNLADLMLYSGWHMISGMIFAAAGTTAFSAAFTGAVVTGGAAVVPILGITTALALVGFFVLGTVIFYILGPLLMIVLLRGADPTSTAMRLATAVGAFAAGGGTLNNIFKGSGTGGGALGKTLAKSNALNNIGGRINQVSLNTMKSTFNTAKRAGQFMDMRSAPFKPHENPTQNKQ